MTAFTEWGELTHVVLGKTLSHAWPEMINSLMKQLKQALDKN